MHRFVTRMIMCLALVLLVGSSAQAQFLKVVSGYLPAGRTNIFFPRVPGNSAQDTIYEISGNYNISGTLVVQEGAEVWFLPNSRMVDSAGGKIIANGFAATSGPNNTPGLNRRILFRGKAVNPNSVEWGHIIALPNADSVFFANVRFVGFMHRNTVDVTPIYVSTSAYAAFNNAINANVNGVGGVLATFDQRTYLYDVIVDSCQASFRGGAFAFLQSPVGWPGIPDDGRLALVNSQVRKLTIRDTRVYNAESTGVTDANALGGAIYMASNSTTQVTSNYVVANLGYQNGPFFPSSQDVMLFERCSANNTLGANNGPNNFAKGGAIYVGSNTGLIISQCTFNNDSAIAPNYANRWGGGIAVHYTSGNPNQTNIGTGSTDRLPGLTILKTSKFSQCVAGLGGAIHMDWANAAVAPYAPRLNIDGEHFVGLVRDSGLIWFSDNRATWEGGAIYTSNPVFITGYLAPQNFPWPGGIDSVELRVRFSDNVAGVGGGSMFLNAAGGGIPDLVERRAWHLRNSVNPNDPRLAGIGALSSWVTNGQVLGGGAEYVGMRDSTFGVEYNNNYTIGGNGGAVAIVDAIAGGNAVAINRYFVEDKYLAQQIKQTPLPYDPRELTRFLNNHAYLGTANDSIALYNYNAGVAHGRGGALYVRITNTGSSNILGQDSTFFSRVRMEQNYAFSGSAIWSDVYDLKMMTNQCLIANNHATSPSSARVDLVDPANGSNLISNPGDVNAGATIWADFEGSLPSYETNSRGDAIYDNIARYILRLPVSPRIGASGVDSLRGNFWGETGPSVITQINPPNGPEQATFFLDYYQGCFRNVYEPNSNPPTSYTPMPIGQVPDTLLMEGRVYDLFDRGTDMKVADYTYRRMAPAEAFSLGLPSDLLTDPNTGHSIHRFTRNIFDTNAVYVNKIDLNQTEFTGPHPIGYPLFLQANASLLDSNRDDYARNYTVLMVFNQTTNEFVRVNAKETTQSEGTGASSQVYQGRLDFVPDSTINGRNINGRQRALYTLSLLRPQTMTFDEIQRASQLEDSAALDGREYQLATSDMVPGAGAAAGDTICTQGIVGNTTWYAGERYHTLPVRPGDRILVVSRTQLWKYGAAYAITHGLQFTIGDVLPPVFVNDIPRLQTDSLNPNVRFVKEDVNYDASDLAHTLFRVAGYDPNNFYDPRFLFNQGNFTQLALNVQADLLQGGNNSPDTNRQDVRLNHWLKQTVIYNQNITGSNGYILLSGTPHNPDVVPGGEGVTATITNYPPNFNSEFLLKRDINGAQLGLDSNALSMWVFPPYMNCTQQPGFLADTLCIRPTTSTYHFRIIVMDSLPRFLNTDARPCGANLTDSLRYTFDIQTDDEMEDSVAAAEMYLGYNPRTQQKDTLLHAWNFPYGKTHYKFASMPNWMMYPIGKNLYRSVSADSSNFVARGIMNVRVDSATAVALLTPIPQVNNNLNLDTVIGVIADDGHTGRSLQQWHVPVNIAPAITTVALPNAKEGVDYSLNFQDPTKVNRISIVDPNAADYHTYQLVYDSMRVWRDKQYDVPSGGIMLHGATPKWLHIDQYSGVLTGTPGLNDAPRFTGACGGLDSVTVVVTDQCQLQTWMTFPLQVDSVQHTPGFVAGPRQICVTNGVDTCLSVNVFDLDLLRDTCAKETLAITGAIGSKGHITITPNSLPGQLQNSDTTQTNVCFGFNEDNTYFSTNPPPPEYITLTVTDANGHVDTIQYAVHVGDKPTFECVVCIRNAVTTSHPLQDIEKLAFGAGSFASDSLDARYCEYEIPPAPQAAAFDSRWQLPVQSSTIPSYVDIRRDTNQYTNITWQIAFQAGNDNVSGSGGSLYPVEICWSKSCLDPTHLTGTFAGGSFYLRSPQNPNEFSINMFTGQGPIDNNLYKITQSGSDTLCLQIRDVNQKNALIVFQPAKSGVDEPTATSKFALEPNYPNPFATETALNFSVAQRSNVRIDIYDLKGTLVRTLVNEQLDPGSYPVTWDGTDMTGAAMANGTYIAQMTAGSFTSSVKMSLEKTGK